MAGLRIALLGAASAAVLATAALAQKATPPEPEGPPPKFDEPAPDVLVDGASAFEPTIDPRPRPVEDPSDSFAADRTAVFDGEPEIPVEGASSFEPTSDPAPRPDEDPETAFAADRTQLSEQGTDFEDDGLSPPDYVPTGGETLPPACDACPEMVRIEGGPLLIGADPNDVDAAIDERVRREVTIAPFALAPTEVTIGQFRAFVDATGYDAAGVCTAVDANGDWDERAGVDWSAPAFPNYAVGDMHPATCVSFDDASAYVAWLNEQTEDGAPLFRLPTEAEFEFVARAGVYTRFAWGDGQAGACDASNGADLEALAVFDFWTVTDCFDGYAFAAPVGSFPPNAFGAFDLIGNVWEWTADCASLDYGALSADGAAQTGGDCSRGILRGGAWVESPEFMRLSERFATARTTRAHWAGFRVARDLGPERVEGLEQAPAQDGG